MICKTCGKEFAPKDWRQKYCSDECRKVAHRAIARKTSNEIYRARRQGTDRQHVLAHKVVKKVQSKPEDRAVEWLTKNYTLYKK